MKFIESSVESTPLETSENPKVFIDHKKGRIGDFMKILCA